MAITPEQRAQLRALAPDHLQVIERMERDAEKRDARRGRKKTAAGPPEITVDLTDWRSKMTLGDAADIEAATGLPFEEVSRRSMTLGAALIWITRRREDPKFTYRQAREISLGELQAMVNAMSDDEEDNDEGEDAGPLGASGSPSA